MKYIGDAKRFFRHFLYKIFPVKSQYARIGRYTLRFPGNTLTLGYKAQFELYDTELANIADVLQRKYPGFCAIDIGANIGDTAALIRGFSDVPVLCVEGDRMILPILKENASLMGPGVVIEPSFLGEDNQIINAAKVNDPGRNASILPAFSSAGDGGSTKLRSLKNVLAEHSSFASAKLLKTDTEGMDFEIIHQSLGFIRQARPVIFFEYDPHFKPSKPDAGLEILRDLIAEGYSDFLYFDNFGNFLTHARSNQTATLADLHAYLASNQRYGAVIYYFDICAFHKEDSDLALALRNDKLTRVTESTESRGTN